MCFVAISDRWLKLFRKTARPIWFCPTNDSCWMIQPDGSCNWKAHFSWLRIWWDKGYLVDHCLYGGKSWLCRLCIIVDYHNQIELPSVGTRAVRAFVKRSECHASRELIPASFQLILSSHPHDQLQGEFELLRSITSSWKSRHLEIHG